MNTYTIELFFIDEVIQPGSVEYTKQCGTLAELIPSVYREIEEWHSTTDMECTGVQIRYDNVILLELSMQDIIRYVNAVSVTVEDRLERSEVVATFILGAKEYDLQLAEVLDGLADRYLQEFNYPDDVLRKRMPPGSGSVEDEKRKLQYLVEFCKIASFQLRGNPAKSW